MYNLETKISQSEIIEESDLLELNKEFQQLNFSDRLARLYDVFDIEKILVTSSFAATSAYFLHIISNINPKQKIHFIDTGFHFPETIEYKKFLSDLYQLDVESLKADDYQHQFSEKEKLFETDPDFCCTINKVNPLEFIKPNFDVWVSSLMFWQTDHRSNLKIFEILC